MSNPITRRGTLGLLGAALVPAVLPTAAAAKAPVFQSFFGAAIRGYDPVAYFTMGKPVEGSSDFESTYMDATWRFASAANKASFDADPEAFAPQYGGYCAYAVANGYTASTDPDAWSLHDGKLYLNYSLSVRDTWSKDIPGNVKNYLAGNGLFTFCLQALKCWGLPS